MCSLHILRGLCLVFPFLLLFTVGCERLHNQADPILIQCDIQKDPHALRQYFLVTANGIRVPKDELSDLRLNNRPLLDRFSGKSCFYLEANEKGWLYIGADQGRLAFLTENFPRSIAEGMNEIKLEPYSRLTDRLGLQSQIDMKLCSDRSRTVYSRSRRIAIPLDLSAFGRVAGLEVTAELTRPSGQSSRISILQEVSPLDAADAPVKTLEIPLPEELKSGESIDVRLQLHDLSKSQIQTSVCNYTYSTEVPELLMINDYNYYPGRYIETAESPSIELKFKSTVPLQSVRFAYEKDGRITEESYPPFKRPHNEWVVVAPKPRLSEFQLLRLQVESESGGLSEHHATMHFGDRIIPRDGVSAIARGVSDNTLILAGHSKRIGFWDLRTKALLKEIEADNDVSELVPSPKGTYLALGYESRTVLVNLIDGKKLSVAGKIKHMQFSADDRMLLGIRENSLVTIHCETAEVIDELKHANTSVYYLTVGQTGDRVAYMTDERDVYTFRLPRLEEPQKITRVEIAGIDQFLLSPSGQFLAYNASEKTYVVDFNQAKPVPKRIHTFEVGDGVRTFRFSPKEDRLFSGSALGKWVISSLDGTGVYPPTEESALQMNAWFKGPILQAEFSASDEEILIGSDDGQTTLFSLKENIAVARSRSEYPSRKIGFFSQGHFLLSSDGIIEIRSRANTNQIFQVNGPINTMSISSSGLIGVGMLSSRDTADADALALDPMSGKFIGKVRHAKALNSVDISPNGQWMLTGSEDNTARLLNLGTGAEQLLDVSFKNGSRPVRKAMFSHQGTSVAVVIHDSIYIQDLFKLNEVLPPIKADKWFPTAGFSHSDKEIYVSNGLNMAGIYDVKTRQLVVKTETKKPTWAASLSQDESMLASLSEDNNLRIDRITRNSAGKILEMNTDKTFHLDTSGELMTFSPDSKFLAFSLWGGNSYVVDLVSNRLVQMPCSRRGKSSYPAFSADSKLVAFGHNSNAFVYQLPDLKPLHVTRHGGFVSSVGFIGETFYSSSWDGTIKEVKLKAGLHATCEEA